jgi:hypothetical protein
VLCVWVKLYWTRHAEPLHPAPLIALACVTVPAVLAAGGLIYFTLWPLPLSPWPPSYYGLYGLVMLLSFLGCVVGAILWRSSPRWLLGVEIAVSVCLFVMSLLAGSTI